MKTGERRWRYVLELAVIVGITALSLSLMSANDAVDRGLVPKLFLVGRIAFLIVLCTWFLRRDGERWSSVGLRAPRRWWMVPLGAAGGFLLIIIVSVVMMNVILPAIGASVPKVQSTPTASEDFLEYLFWAFIVSWGTAAVGEELLARGFILDRVTKLLGSTGTTAVLSAVFLQAAIFGGFHIYQGVGGVLVTTAAGLVLGLVWFFSGRNLWAPILLHGTVDFLAANGL